MRRLQRLALHEDRVRRQLRPNQFMTTSPRQRQRDGERGYPHAPAAYPSHAKLLRSGARRYARRGRAAVMRAAASRHDTTSSPGANHARTACQHRATRPGRRIAVDSQRASAGTANRMIDNPRPMRSGMPIAWRMAIGS